MEERWQRNVSIISNLSASCIAVWWLNDANSKAEPVLVLITAILSAVLQIVGWKIRGKQYQLQASPTGEPQSIPRLLDFVKDEPKIIVKPQSTRKEYWRLGFKMGRTPTIAINGPLEQGTVLFSIDQTNDQIKVNYYNEQNNPDLHNHVIVTNYKQQDIELHILKKPGTTRFEIHMDGGFQYGYEVNHQYRYSRLISWGDNNYYNLNVVLKDKKWLGIF